MRVGVGWLVLAAGSTLVAGLVVGFVVGVLAGAAQTTPPGSSSSAPSSSAEAVPKKEAKKAKAAETKPAGPPMEVSGTGSDVVMLSGLSAGAVTFSYEYEGESNFIVTLLDTSGRRVDAIANEIGSASGSKVVRVEEPGDYFVNVDADPQGLWTLTGPPEAR